MKFIFAILIISILTIYLVNYLTYRRKRDAYRKAGKKWDEIVTELSKRK